MTQEQRLIIDGTRKLLTQLEFALMPETQGAEIDAAEAVRIIGNVESNMASLATGIEGTD